MKADDIDIDVFDGDLILMKLDTRQVLVLNEAAHVLWSALDRINTRDGLLDLLREARPDDSEDEAALRLDEVLAALTAGGFLRSVPALPGEPERPAVP